MKSELEQFESMERGGVSDNEILVGRIKGAWAELMPDVKWVFIGAHMMIPALRGVLRHLLR